jgi:hypothetical protein
MALVTEAKAVDYVKIAVLAWLGVFVVNRALRAMGAGQFAATQQANG